MAGTAESRWRTAGTAELARRAHTAGTAESRSHRADTVGTAGTAGRTRTGSTGKALRSDTRSDTAERFDSRAALERVPEERPEAQGSTFL